jgi:hypothetical protein
MTTGERGKATDKKQSRRQKAAGKRSKRQKAKDEGHTTKKDRG